MKNIVFFGAPGAGKGTQAKKLAEKFKLIHISTGDVLRAEVNNKTELGLKAQTYMQDGNLVPDDLIISMVEKIIAANLKAEGFILDGFPRTKPQAEALDIMLKKYKIEISDVLFLDVPKEELIVRLQKRAELEGRDDDKDLSVVENRINVYNQKTAPVIDYYSQQGKLKKIIGIGNISEIFESIIKILS